MSILENKTQLDEAFRLLDGRLRRNGAGSFRVVVCGGAALLGSGLLVRPTKDVDIVALRSSDGSLISPAPLPSDLLTAVEQVAATLALPPDWLNNGPSRDEGGLFQLGLPHNVATRLTATVYGDHLTIFWISRLDQIHFKLYAAVDRGGYHTSDLLALAPTEDELRGAAAWAMTCDVSDGFRQLMAQLLEQLGYGRLAAEL